MVAFIKSPKKLIALALLLFIPVLAPSQTARDLLLAGNRKFSQQKYLAAMTDYKQALQLNPKMAKAYHNLGNVNYILQNYEDALINFTKAIELSPNDPEPLSSRGALFFALREYEKAMQDLDMAIRIDPGFAAAYTMRGSLNHRLSNGEPACADWHQAAEMGSQEATDLLSKYCDSDFKPRRFMATRGEGSAQIHTLEITEASKFRMKGESQLEIRDYEGAVLSFDKALEFDPNDGKAYLGRGAARFAIGDHDGACEDYHKAIDLGVSDAHELVEHGCK